MVPYVHLPRDLMGDADVGRNRQRRGRSPKTGGGHASMISSNINLLNTSTSTPSPVTERFISDRQQSLAPERLRCPQPCHILA